MSLEMFMFAAAVFLFGLGSFLLGYASGIASQKKRDINALPKKVGTLLIETTDPDGPYLFVSLDVPVDEVGINETVAMNVVTNGSESSRI